MKKEKPPFWFPVKCSGYLKKEHDGRFIELLKDEGGHNVEAKYWADEGDDVPDECLCEGSYDFLKTYYKLVEMGFTGVAVGEKDVITTAWLYADTGYRYDGDEYVYCGKQPEGVVRCAIVYYQPGKKRYVPIDRIEKLPAQ